MPPANALQAIVSASPLFVCAWCGDGMGRAARPKPSANHPDGRSGADARAGSGPDDGGAFANYGICRSCLDARLASLGADEPSRRIVKRSPARGEAPRLRAAQ